VLDFHVRAKFEMIMLERLLAGFLGGLKHRRQRKSGFSKNAVVEWGVEGYVVDFTALEISLDAEGMWFVVAGRRSGFGADFDMNSAYFCSPGAKRSHMRLVSDKNAGCNQILPNCVSLSNIDCWIILNKNELVQPFLLQFPVRVWVRSSVFPVHLFRRFAIHPSVQIALADSLVLILLAVCLPQDDGRLRPMQDSDKVSLVFK
jgi:hypothetical protein